MIDLELKNKIIKLRKSGLTYSEINNKLETKIPKSTLSSICSKVTLSNENKKRIINIRLKNQQKAQKLAVVANKLKRNILLENIQNKNIALVNKSLNKDTLKIILSVLYLGEGSKWKSHRGLMLGSSDPYILNLYINLLKICYNIGKIRLRCRISYRVDQNINELEKTWSKLLNIPRDQFYKTIPDPRTVGKPTRNNDYIGVCVVSGGGTEIQLELEDLAKQIGPVAQR